MTHQPGTTVQNAHLARNTTVGFPTLLVDRSRTSSLLPAMFSVRMHLKFKSKPTMPNYALFVAALVASVDVARSSGWFGLNSDRNAQLTACAAQFGGPVTFFTPSQEPWWGEWPQATPRTPRTPRTPAPDVKLCAPYWYSCNVVSSVVQTHFFLQPFATTLALRSLTRPYPDGVADASTGKPSGYDVCSHLKAGLCTKV